MAGDARRSAVMLRSVPQRWAEMRGVAWLQSLRGRLMLVLFAVGVVPIAIVAALSLPRQQEAYLELTGRALSATANDLGQSLDRYFFERYGDVQVQARTLDISSGGAALTQRLDDLIQLYRPAYALLVIADAQGTIIATNTVDGAGHPLPVERLRNVVDVRNETWFRKAMSGTVRQPIVEELHDAPLLRTVRGDGVRAHAVTFTMPIERGGKVAGVVRMFGEWEAVTEIVSAALTHARENGYAAANLHLLDSAGTNLYSPQGDVMRRLGGHPIVVASQKPNATGAMRGAGFQDDGEVVAGFYRTRGYSDYPGLGWSVVASEPVSAAAGVFRAMLERTVVVALLVALAIVFLSVFLASYLTRPLGLMARTLHELASGEADLSQRLPARRADEIGIVSRSFNTFVDNLQRLIDQVIRAGMQVMMSSTQISAGSRQLEATMAEQVAATNEVVATTNEIAATANDLASTMSAVAKMSEETADAASHGQRDVHRMSDAIARMEEATHAVSARLAAINEKAANISSVVTTITKVADQTNLLSLNAAIEAEKAGQFGQGFAVVAREIRRLADQTAVATLDIEKMVREMKSAVSTGVMSMEKLNEQVAHSVESVREVGGQLDTIIGKVQEVTPRFESAHVGMQAQLQGAQQISQAMLQLSESTQQTASALRESNDAIGGLNDAASALQSMFARFKLTEA
jgi:methyl-accepting chemotaxis protein